MAISAAIEWDVQSVGADTNGGGFNVTAAGGTDYSQVGATPHVAFDGVTISATTSGVSTTILITGYAAASTDLGNVVQISGGTNFIAGFYEIQAVNPGVSGVGTWTLDRNCTSGIGAGMTGAMGGSLATPNKIMSEATALVAGQTIHIKNATYTRTTTISLGASGSVAAGSINVIGYTTAHIDILNWAGMANAPLLTSASTSVDIITFNGKTLWKFNAIQVTSTAATRGNGFSSAASMSGYDLVFISALNGFFRTGGSPTVQMSRSEVKGCTAAGIVAGNFFGTACWIHGNATFGINMLSAGTVALSRCVLDHNNTGNSANTPALNCTSPLSIDIADTVIANNTGSNTDGIFFTTAGASNNFLMTNSILYGNGRYNLNTASPGGMNVILNNAWGGAGTANINGALSTGINPTTLTANPFTNSAANGDFSLNNNAGGGALLRSLGYPGAFPGGTMTGYADTGALQHQNTGGAGGYSRSRTVFA